MVDVELPASTMQYCNVEKMLRSLCDQTSPYFALRGLSHHALESMLFNHNIPCCGLSYDLCHQVLCHHILNGMCALSQGSLCVIFSGSCSVKNLAQSVGVQLLNIVCEPSFPLNLLHDICLGLGFHSSGPGEHLYLINELQNYCDRLFSDHTEDPPTFLIQLESATKSELLARAAAHGITCCGTTDAIRNQLSVHFLNGDCNRQHQKLKACGDICASSDPGIPRSDYDHAELQASILSAILYDIP